MSDLADVLDEVEVFLDDYVVFSSPEQRETVTLWASATWMSLAPFDAWAYLAITSPEKQSGKTRLLETLNVLVHKPWMTVMPSPAALYAKIQQDRPTLLLDEIDAVFKQKSDSSEALRGVLNAGNRRGGTVPRVRMVGQQRLVEEFNVFGPKALAGIKSLPETLADRSIAIPLRRKTRDEKVEPFRSQVVHPRAASLRQRLEDELRDAPDEAWVRSFDRMTIQGLSDRQIEGWQPMLSLAGMAGRDWLPRAMKAAKVVGAAQREEDDTAVERRLLEHIRDAFLGTDRIRTSDLLDELRKRDDGPWAEMFDKTWDLDNQKSAARLARMLKPYGITSRRPRFEGPGRRDRPGHGLPQRRLRRRLVEVALSRSLSRGMSRVPGCNFVTRTPP